jgi:hypothetical protein
MDILLVGFEKISAEDMSRRLVGSGRCPTAVVKKAQS